MWRTIAVVTCLCCVTTFAHANQVQPAAPPSTATTPAPSTASSPPPSTAPTAAPSTETAPSTEPAPSALDDQTPQQLFIEVPPPPPSYGPPTLAQPPPTPPLVQTPEELARRHRHAGFFVRGSLGVGVMTAREDNRGMQLRALALALPFRVAVGTSLRENLIVFGELHVTIAPNPRIEIDDERRHHIDSITLIALSAGATYYLMPHNLHVTASVGFGGATANTRTSSTRSEPVGATGPGIALHLSVGKEWWTGPHWGVGGALFGQWMSLPDGDHSTLSVIVFGACATATYN